MQPEVIIAALIGAIIGAAVTLIVGLRQNRIDRDKLQLERTQSIEQNRVWTAEVAKLQAEVAKFQAEEDNLKSQTSVIKGEPNKANREANRDKITEYLALFERAAFRPWDGENAGDPTAVFNAIRDTRIKLQKGKASLIADANLANQFSEIQDLLWKLEQDVEAKYPPIVSLAAKWKGKPLGTAERINDVREGLGGVEKYEEAAIFIRAQASDVFFAKEKIHDALLALNAELAQY